MKMLLAACLALLAMSRPAFGQAPEDDALDEPCKSESTSELKLKSYAFGEDGEPGIVFIKPPPRLFQLKVGTEILAVLGSTKPEFCILRIDIMIYRRCILAPAFAMNYPSDARGLFSKWLVNLEGGSAVRVPGNDLRETLEQAIGVYIAENCGAEGATSRAAGAPRGR